MILPAFFYAVNVNFKLSTQTHIQALHRKDMRQHIL